MSASPRPSGPVAISGQPPGERVEEDALGIPEDDRYREGGLLGRGGMGEVRTVRDRRLKRDVARKVVAEDDPASEARLAREARITARLEHPGIVPVYDAGRDDDGRSWYTMRVIRGRTLADALADAPEPADRAALLRHFLDACEAVAFAHSLGVIHRDLKPSNILVGEFGETQVADWGLARVLAEPDLTSGPRSLADSSLTVDGDVIGTPAFMSPEQAVGRPADERSDVWSLGTILFEILTGTPLWTGRPEAILEMLNTRDPTPVRERRADAPVELAAVAARALARDRDDRYASAGELAADLSQWFDGRQVSAYEYSAWDLLARFVRAWRAPLAVAATATLIGTVGAALVFQQTAHERDRAQLAEAETRAALADADRNLALLMVDRARAALAVDDRPTAEKLAAGALRKVPSPEARGVLAAYAGVGRPQKVATTALGAGCGNVFADADASFIGCTRTDRTQVIVDGHSLELPSWVEAIGRTESHLIYTSPNGLEWLEPQSRAVLDAQPPAGTVLVVQPGTQTAVAIGNGHFAVVAPNTPQVVHEPCGRAVPSRVAVTRAGRTVTTCDNGAVWSGTLEEPAKTLLWEDPDRLAASLSAQGTQAVLATYRGEVIHFDLEGTVHATHRWGRIPIVDVDLDSTGARVLLTGQRGRVAILELQDGSQLTSFPTSARLARWRTDDRVRLVGDDVEDWDLAGAMGPVRFRGSEGVASVALSDDGRQIATGHGDGVVTLWDTATGIGTDVQWQDGVIKDVTFSPDGRQLAATGVRGQTRVLDRDGERVADLGGRRLRRLLWTDAGLTGLTYSRAAFQSWHTLEDGADGAQSGEVSMVDLEAAPDGRMVGLDRRRGIHRIESLEPHLLVTEPLAEAVAAGTDSIVTVLPGWVVAMDWEGRERFRVEGPSKPIDVAIADDGTIAAGALDGTLWVWDASGQLELRVQAHDERISALAFGADRRLVTGSWDWTVRLWDLNVLQRTPDALADEIRLAWGTGDP